MNALERNRYTEAWRALAASISRPRAVLVVSAHWFTNATAVTAMPRPRTIHDFYGFPDALFAVQYPAPGASDVAAEIAEVAKPHFVGQDRDSWGLDHGAWSILRHMFPLADVPVVQLSINSLKPFDFHLDLGARLAPLRERGVLIVGSGNVVHNLRRLDWSQPERAFEWTRRFDDAARAIMTTTPRDILTLESHPDFPLAVPTPDHFVPLIYLAGLAEAAGRSTDVLVEGYAMGSLSMICFTLEGASPAPERDARPAAGLPEPEVVPPDDTNM
jgi:4,5-DOPA dioxygenase extradiol